MNQNFERLCMGCMAAEQTPGHPCPRCGFQEENDQTQPHVLPLRTILAGKYLVGKCIGQGGFGIIYLGWDLNLELKLAIKEYYPDGFVSRDCSVNTTVTAYTGEEGEFYRSGLEKFVDEAKRLAQFYSLPGIVSVRDYFRENGTAYIVMEFIEGVTLKDYLKDRGGKIPITEAMSMLEPVMGSLKVVHNNHIIHRDISPDNIMIDHSGRCHLLDFGAAREYGKEGSQTILLKHGYAPYEQYQSHGSQGPWTDVYAMSATVYRCITGEVPVPAPDRFPQDVLQPPSALGAHLSPWQEQALMKGLAREPQQRWQDMDQLRQALKKGGPPPPDPAPKKDLLQQLKTLTQKTIAGVTVLFQKSGTQNREKSGKKLSPRVWLALAGSGGVLALAVLVLPRLAQLPASGTLEGASSSSQTAVSSTSQEESRAEIAPIEQWDGGAQGQDPSLRQPEDPDAVVQFSDWALEYHVSSALGKDAGEITQQDLAQVRQLHICDISGSVNEIAPDDTGRTSKMGDGSQVPHLSSLEDLKYFINLEELSLTAQDFTDLSPLSQLTNLTVLNLHNSNLSDLSPLSGLTNLEVLDIGGNYLNTPTDLSPLRNLTNLRELYLDGVRNLTNLSPLESLTNLEVLDLGYTGYDAMKNRTDYMDLSFLSRLTKLKKLDLASCKVGTLETFSSLTALEELDLSGCPVSDLNPLSGLSQLRVLSFYSNEEGRKVQNLSPLANLTQLEELTFSSLSSPDLTPLEGLTQMKKLSIVGSTLTDLTPLAGMTQMEELTLSLNEISDLTPLEDMTRLTLLELDQNLISDLSPLAGMTQVTTLDLHENQISDLAPLAEMKELKYLTIAENPVSDLSPLAGLEQLIYLDAFQCPITDLTPLRNLRNLKTFFLTNGRIVIEEIDWSPVSHVENVRGRPE